MTKNPRVAVLGAARDVERFVPALIRNLLNIRLNYPESEFFIFESDSSDQTARTLSAWAKAFDGLHVKSLGKLRGRLPLRTQRLAYVRNQAYSMVRGKPFDYVVWMDLDDVTANRIPSNFLDITATAPSDWGFLTATKEDKYYDIWALRHPEICPFDCIAELNKAGWDQEWAHEKFSREPGRRVLEALRKDRFLRVDSAFGGFGVLKNDRDLGPNPFVGLYPDGTETIEWLSFCTKIQETGGRIYIDRDLRIG